MTMDPRPDTLIDALVENLQPVRAMRQRDGRALFVVATLATLAAVALIYGFRPGLMQGSVSALFLITNGLFLLLGLAAANSVILMGNPRVGARHDGTRWAVAMAALLPITALVTGVAARHSGSLLHISRHDLLCPLMGMGFGLLIAAGLLFWLRRGAPVSLARAGLHLGIAAGALGTFAWGMACPFDTLHHLGLWHSLAIVVSAAIGRLAVPAMIRW